MNNIPNNGRMAADIVSEYCKIDPELLMTLHDYYPETIKAIETLSTMEPRMFIKPIYVETPEFKDNDDKDEYRHKLIDVYNAKFSEILANIPEVDYNGKDPYSIDINSRAILSAITNVYTDALRGVVTDMIFPRAYTDVSSSANKTPNTAFIVVLFEFNTDDEECKIARTGMWDTLLARKLYDEAARYRDYNPTTTDPKIAAHNSIRQRVNNGDLYLPNNMLPQRIIDDPNITTTFLSEQFDKLFRIFELVMIVPKTGFANHAIDKMFENDEDHRWICYYNDDDEYVACQAALANGAEACVMKCCIGSAGDDDSYKDISILVLNADADDFVKTVYSITQVVADIDRFREKYDDSIIPRYYGVNCLYPDLIINELYDSFDIVNQEFIKKLNDATLEKANEYITTHVNSDD